MIVPAGTYRLSRTGEDAAGNLGDLNITSSVTVKGAGAASTIIDGNSIARIFAINGGPAVTLDGLTVQNGSAESGGGVFNSTYSRGDRIRMANTILANNKDTGRQAADCSGEISSYSYNLVRSTKGCTIRNDGTGNIYGSEWQGACLEVGSLPLACLPQAGRRVSEVGAGWGLAGALAPPSISLSPTTAPTMTSSSASRPALADSPNSTISTLR